MPEEPEAVAAMWYCGAFSQKYLSAWSPRGTAPKFVEDNERLFRPDADARESSKLEQDSGGVVVSEAAPCKRLLLAVDVGRRLVLLPSEFIEEPGLAESFNPTFSAVV